MQELSIKLELKDEELVALKGELSEITKRFEKHMQINEEAERVFNQQIFQLQKEKDFLTQQHESEKLHLFQQHQITLKQI